MQKASTQYRELVGMTPYRTALKINNLANGKTVYGDTGLFMPLQRFPSDSVNMVT